MLWSNCSAPDKGRRGRGRYNKYSFKYSVHTFLLISPIPHSHSCVALPRQVPSAHIPGQHDRCPRSHRLGKNSLATATDINLFMVSDENFIRSGAMSSRIGQLCIIDILFSIVTSRLYSEVKPYLDRSMNASKKKKTLMI